MKDRNKISNKNIVANTSLVDKKITKIIDDGKEKLHIIADFDGTLTKGYTSNGEKVPSLISVLRDEDYLTPDYSKKAKALFAKYYPIEQDSTVSIAEKSIKMEEWRENHSQLLIKSGLNKEDIEKAAKSSRITFRKYTKEFLKLIETAGIPLIILSASGLGEYAIKQVMIHHNIPVINNSIVISNRFERDSKGNAIQSVRPHIHSLNKSESSIKNHAFFDKIEERKNVILLGNNIGDSSMADGYKYNTILKIGFYNEMDIADKKSYNIFLDHYDIVVLYDGSMEYILNTVKKITKTP